jgi:hypothetical protein
MTTTEQQPYIKDGSTQHAKHKLEKVLILLNLTMTTKIVEAVKTFFHFLSQNLVDHAYQRHKIKLFEPVQEIKWTQKVIILAKELSTKIMSSRKIVTRLKLNRLVLHLDLSVKKHSRNPELNTSVLQT